MTLEKFVIGLSLDDPAIIQTALKELQKTPKNQDSVVIAIYTALKRGCLKPCSKTAAIISGIILETQPQRNILRRIARGINDPKMAEIPYWEDEILFEDIDIPVEQRRTLWRKISRVREIESLFARNAFVPARGRNLCPDPIPSDLLEEGWRHGPNGELLRPDEPDPPIVPEIAEDE